jgi:hypothetical protein
MTSGRAHASLVSPVAHAVGVVVAVAVTLASTVAAADEPPPMREELGAPRARTDTTYGRIEGDVALSLGAGATFGPRAPRGAVDLRFRYLDTAGLFVAYEDGAVFGASAVPERLAVVGAELRPLFLARWGTGLGFARPRLDLFLDSFGLELGVFWAQLPGEAFAKTSGLQFGVGLEFPLAARASGPWIGLHPGLRWSERALAGGGVETAAERAAYVNVTLRWHELVHARLVGRETR